MSNVTVIADEKLGGVEREYAEVKRKARVGERIKFNRKESGYTPGKIYETYAYPSGGLAGDVVFKDDDGYIRWPEHNQYGYVVLEPSEIVRIDGVRYRMVERKARVGERVISRSGEVYGVSEALVADSRMLNVGFVNRHIFNFSVLEPVAAAAHAPSPPQPDIQRTLDGLTEAVAVLTRRLTEAETQLRVAREDIVLIEEGVVEIAKRPSSYVEVASGTVDDRLPSFVTRDSIVERAKRDVAKLTAPPSVMRTGSIAYDYEFVVNREKRTVVALVTGPTTKKVYHRGIAKCAPDDVFNSAIGKAIALRRALGLEVPAEYVKVPQPTEIRVGDVVWYSNKYSRLLVTEEKTNVSATPPTIGMGFLRTTSGNRILDDSREEVAA